MQTGDQEVLHALDKFDDHYRDVYRGSEASPLNQPARQLAEPSPTIQMKSTFRITKEFHPP